VNAQGTSKLTNIVNISEGYVRKLKPSSALVNPAAISECNPYFCLRFVVDLYCVGLVDLLPYIRHKLKLLLYDGVAVVYSVCIKSV
jgi:hypothetical protein